MIGITNIGGGGGSSLNFKVVGGASAPTSPSENTIWVNTSVAITSWVFSATAPTSPTAGMVWFKTDASHAITFNAIKKNGLWVYPAACHQYVSDTWACKTAQAYQAGEWVNWLTYLFSCGYNNTDLAGSPLVKGVKYDSSGGGTAVTPTLTLNSDSISLVCNAASVEAGSGILYWSKAVDVTDFNILELVAVNNSASGTTGWIRLGVADTVPSYIEGWSCTNTALSAYTGEMQFDLSDITGEKYIIIGFHRGNQSWAIKSVELT